MGYMLLPGDSKELLKTLPDNSVDSFVMDPPYDLTSIQKRFGKANSAPPIKWKGKNSPHESIARGFMGKTWDGTGIAFDPAFWEQVIRVLKPGGHVAAFGGSRTYHRMAVAMEDAGLEIRDSLFWVYGSGFPKSHDISKAIDKKAGAEREVVAENSNHRSLKVNGITMEGQPHTGDGTLTAPATEDAQTWDGWGTALKPAQEPIVLARKPISEKSVAANVLRWGTGAINIGASRVGTNRPPTTAKDFTAWRAMEGRTDSQVAKPDTNTNQGRWPANVLLTCCGMVPHRPG